MRIGIVNHEPEATEVLRRALALVPEREVAWTAAGGEAAVELCCRDRPDLVLLDLFLPDIDGVETSRRIMAAAPCAILLVTAGIDAHAGRVFQAMGHGALDAVDLPVLEDASDLAGVRAGCAPLLAKVEAIAGLLGRRRTGFVSAARTRLKAGRGLVAIGASAGGPAALAQLLGALPADFPVPIVIVQHVDVQFALGMAQWLDKQVPLSVRLACEQDVLNPGEVLLAGTQDHLVLRSGQRLGYTPEPEDCAYRPSVDAFFRSVCRHWRGAAVGILLTGMGRDGALGLKAMRNHGWHTIAQDQASSAVYGMPKAAARVAAAAEILPLAAIAPRLVSMVTLNRGSGW